MNIILAEMNYIEVINERRWKFPIENQFVFRFILRSGMTKN